MNNEEQPVVGESNEEFEARKSTEVDALLESLSSSGINGQEADDRIEELVGKHQAEREMNMVFPDLDAYRDFKAAESFTPPPPFIKSVDAPASIEAVATPASEEEEGEATSLVADEPWKKVVGYINAVDTLDQEQKKAKLSLLGGKKEKGSSAIADQLEEKQEALAVVDERILNKDELREHRIENARVERELSLVRERKGYSAGFIKTMEEEKDDNIELVLQNIQELPEELVGAIRTNDNATLEKYGVNAWAAGKVARALEQHDIKEEQRLHAENEQWRDIASAVGTPKLQSFSRVEIRKALEKKGIDTATLAEGLELLKAEFEKTAQGAGAAEVSAVLTPNKESVPEPKNFLGRVAQATGGEEIPLHVIENIQKVGTAKEKAWAEKELELRKSTVVSAPVKTPDVVDPPSDEISGAEEFAQLSQDIEKAEKVLADINALPPGKLDKNIPIRKADIEKFLATAKPRYEVLRGKVSQTPEQEVVMVEAKKEGEGSGLTERILSGEVDVKTLPPATLKTLLARKNKAYDLLLEEISRREEAKKNETSESDANQAAQKNEEKLGGPSSFDATLKFIQQGRGDVIPLEMLKRHAGSDPEIAAYYETRLKAEEDKTEKEAPVVSPSEPPPPPTLPLSPGIYAASAVSGLEALGYEPGITSEGDVDKAEAVFGALDVLGDTPSAVDENKEEPLIEKNFTGAPEFVPKEALQLDAQGEAMKHLIDATPEVVNLGKTENAPEAPPQNEAEEKKETVQEEKEELQGFDPELELDKILKAPTSERKALLETYKEKLAAQKVGLAKVQAAMVEDIRKNPDMTKEEFEKLFGDRAEKYQATNEQKAIGSAIFEKFQEKHHAVEKTRMEHPDDAELFATLFGQAPKGKVEVIKGPMTLYFRCHDLKDYALIDSGKCLMENATITEQDIKEASMSGGKGRVRTLVPELSGTVLAENTEGRPYNKDAEQILAHEEQHAINGIMQREIEKDFNYTQNNFMAHQTLLELKEVRSKLNTADASERAVFEKEATELKDKIKLLNVRHLRALRRHSADDRAQDEILAYTRDGRNLPAIYVQLTQKKSDGGLYDYMDNRTKGLRMPASYWINEDSELIQELREGFEVQKKEIFETEYQEVLKSGLNAYQKLRDAGYKEEAIRGIFHDEPLTRWEKVVDRLVEHEKDIPESIIAKYEKQFSIPEKDLRSIDGFRDLSEGQQLLVLERMKSVAFDDINTEKVSRYRARIDELSKSSSWWDKLKSVGMKATKQFQLGRMKDEVSAEWLKGGDVDAAAMKKDALEGLVAQALQTKEFGVFEHDGKLSTAFISPKDFGQDIDEATKTQILDFNEVANLYANKAFAEDDEAGKAQLKQQYDEAARNMTRLLAEKDEGKWSGDNAAAWRTKLEGAVQMSRFFQDNSEVDIELAQAGKNIGSAIGFKNLLVERGTYTVASGGARWLGVSALGLAALPAVAAIGGGVMGWRRAKQELSENDLLAAMGERDKSDDKAHKKEPGSNENDRAKNVVSSDVLVTKLGDLLKEYESASETEMVETSARDENGRLRFQDTPNGEGKHIVMEQVSKKESLKRSLEARVAYTTRKMEEQLIDLGSARADRALRIASLAQTLGKAQSELGFADEGINALETRLDNILDIREEKIEVNRQAHLVKQAAKGAMMGAAFSGAGLLVGGMLPGHAKVGSGMSLSESVHRLDHAIAGKLDEFMDKARIPHPLGDQHPNDIADSLSPGEQLWPDGHGLSNHVAENIPSDDEVATLVYDVKAGENLSHIMKAHLSIFNDLTPKQQENVIQNFIRDLSPQDMKDIGITDVDHISVGQHIQVDRLNEILAAKRIGGIDLIEHAQHLGAATPQTDGPTWIRESIDTPATVSAADAAPTGGAGVRELVLSPLSSEDAAAIEHALGRSLSGSESHVLHSLKGLAPLAESDAEQQTLGAALDHLQKEMQATGGRPLTMAEMQRILHEHNGLDAKIVFPEATTVSAPSVVAESAPVSSGYAQGQWEHLAESAKPAVAEHLAKDYLTEDTNRIFGKDVFGNPAQEWVLLRERSAEEVFGADQVGPTEPSIMSIQGYIKAEGFSAENGYMPNKGENVQQFLERAHKLRVLTGGPRPEND